MAVTSLTIIGNDGIEDLALLEVLQRLQLELPSFQFQTLSVPALNTLGAGFSLAQLALNPGLAGRLYYYKCDPRKDKTTALLDSEGKRLTYVLLPNDVRVVGVLSGYTLSFLKTEAEALHYLDVDKAGALVRSRDLFPLALSAIAKGDYSLLGEKIDPDTIPNVPDNLIAWIDGYGNLKTTIKANMLTLEPGTKLAVNIGDVLTEATYTDSVFNVPEGELALAPGSSGWLTSDGTQLTWMELTLRSGSAYELFGRPKISQTISNLKAKTYTTPLLELHTA